MLAEIGKCFPKYLEVGLIFQLLIERKNNGFHRALVSYLT
jgi:hypothetical protein